MSTPQSSIPCCRSSLLQAAHHWNTSASSDKSSPEKSSFSPPFRWDTAQRKSSSSELLSTPISAWAASSSSVMAIQHRVSMSQDAASMPRSANRSANCAAYAARSFRQRSRLSCTVELLWLMQSAIARIYGTSDTCSGAFFFLKNPNIYANTTHRKTPSTNRCSG